MATLGVGATLGGNRPTPRRTSLTPAVTPRKTTPMSEGPLDAKEDAVRRSTITLQQHQKQVQEHMKRVSLAVGQYDEQMEQELLDAERRKVSDFGDVDPSPRCAQLMAELALLPPALPSTDDPVARVTALEHALDPIPALSTALEDLDMKAFTEGGADIVELAFESTRIVLADVYSAAHSLALSLPQEIRAAVLTTNFRGLLRALRSALASSRVGTERLEAFRWKVEDIEAENTQLKRQIKELEARVASNSMVSGWAQDVSVSSQGMALRQGESYSVNRSSPLTSDQLRPQLTSDPASPGPGALAQAVVFLQVENAAFIRRVAEPAYRTAMQTVKDTVDELCQTFGGTRSNYDPDAKDQPDGHVCVFTRVEGAVFFSAELQRALLGKEWSSALQYYGACRPVLRETGKPAPLQNTDLAKTPLLWNGVRVRCAVHCGTLPPPAGDPPWYGGAVVQRLGRLLQMTPGGMVYVSSRCWSAFEAIDSDTERKLQWTQDERDLASMIDSDRVQQGFGARGGDAVSVFVAELKLRSDANQANAPSEQLFSPKRWWEEDTDGDESSDKGTAPADEASAQASDDASANSRMDSDGNGTSRRRSSGGGSEQCRISPRRSSIQGSVTGMADEDRETYEEIQKLLAKKLHRMGAMRHGTLSLLESTERQRMADCDPMYKGEAIEQLHRFDSWEGKRLVILESSESLISTHSCRFEGVAEQARSLGRRRSSVTYRSRGGSRSSPQPNPLAVDHFISSVKKLQRLNSIDKKILQLRAALNKRKKRTYPPLQRMHGIVRAYAMLMRQHLNPDEKDVSALSPEQFMQHFIKKCNVSMKTKGEVTSVRANWRDLEEQCIEQDEEELPDEGQRLADSIGGHLAKTFQCVKAWRRRQTVKGKQDEASPSSRRPKQEEASPASRRGSVAGIALHGSIALRMRARSSRGSIAGSPLGGGSSARNGEVEEEIDITEPSPTAAAPVGEQRKRQSLSHGRGTRTPTVTKKVVQKKGADVDFIQGLSGMDVRQRALQDRWNQRRGEGAPDDKPMTPPGGLPALKKEPSPRVEQKSRTPTGGSITPRITPRI